MSKGVGHLRAKAEQSRPFDSGPETFVSRGLGDGH